MNARTKMEPPLRLRGVTKRFEAAGNVYTALEGIDFTAGSGKLALLLGPSGSGKTTLLTVAAGFVGPTAGEVELFGTPLASYRPRALQQLRASRIGFVFQTFLLIDALSVAENVLLQLRFAGVSAQQARRRVQDALERVGIAELAGKRPTELSHGERQRIAIARALAIDAAVLIADEPTASLDSTQGERIIRMLHGYAEERGKCVLVASHDLRLRDYAHEICHMENGRIVRREGPAAPARQRAVA